jgi:hypothetical protein
MASLSSLLTSKVAPPKPTVPDGTNMAQPTPGFGTFLQGIGSSVGKPISGAINSVNQAVSDPYGLNALLNSDAYKAYGNNTQAYDAAYQNSISAQRSNITQMFGAAMQDIANRQGAGDAAIGALPGQISAAYAPAEQSVKDNAAAAEAGQRASGLSTFLPASAISQPAVTAMETSQAAHQADVPVLHQAINTELGKERTTVQTQQAQSLADLAAKEADHAASMQQTANDPSWMQKLLIQNQMDSVAAKKSNDAKAQATAAATKQKLLGLQAKTQTVGPKSGTTLINSPLAAESVVQIRSGGAGRASAAYNEMHGLIADATKTKDPKRAHQLWQQLQAKYPKQGMAFNIALADSGLNAKDWATIQNGG